MVRVRIRIRVRFGVRFKVSVRFRLGLGHSCVLARCASGLDPTGTVVNPSLTADRVYSRRPQG